MESNDIQGSGNPDKKAAEKYLKDAGDIENIPDGPPEEHKETRNTAYFMEKLGVTEDEVIAAVEVVGADPEKIEEYIRRQHDEQ